MKSQRRVSLLLASALVLGLVTRVRALDRLVVQRVAVTSSAERLADGAIAGHDGIAPTEGLT